MSEPERVAKGISSGRERQQQWKADSTVGWGWGEVNPTSKYTPLSIMEVRFLTIKEGGYKYVNWLA